MRVRYVCGITWISALAVTTGAAAPAPKKARPPAVQPVAAPAAVDPQKIWPASLERIAGRFVYAQVASPGGLWATFTPPNEQGEITRQVSLWDAPAELRDKLRQAEIVISGLKKPGKIEASERVSPSKRGLMRFYSETAEGTLTLRNIPGIGGAHNDAGEHQGPVVFELEHQAHSNPSVFGIQQIRDQQEPTWGVGALDYADLRASAPATADDPEGPPPVIGNARVLRGGLEIICYVDWTQQDGTRERRYRGSIRLRKVAERPEGGAALPKVAP